MPEFISMQYNPTTQDKNKQTKLYGFQAELTNLRSWQFEILLDVF